MRPSLVLSEFSSKTVFYGEKGTANGCELNKEGGCNSAPNRPNELKFWMLEAFKSLF